MKTNKSKLLVLLALVSAFVLAMSCLFITACGDKEKTEKCAIEWKIADNATVTVEGYSELPSEWDKDTDLAFTVSAPEGYDVSVRAYSIVSPNNGKYSFKVTKNATVTVTTERTLTGITVATSVDLEKTQYFVDDVIKDTDVTVTANYSVGDSKVLTDGFTIEHGKYGKVKDAEGNEGTEDVFTANTNSAKFAEGNNAFRISYKGFYSQVFVLELPAKNPFGFTSVDIEVGADGKPYYVLTGTYALSLVDDFKHVGFDFQIQGGYSTGKWTYTKYNINMPEENLVDGVYTLRVDMSALADLLETNNVPSMLFLPHMGFNPPGDNSGNLNVYAENYTNGKSIEVNGIKYALYFEKYQSDGSNGTTTSYDMVGVLVSDADFKPTKYYADSDVTLDSFWLEVKDDKPVVVIKGSVANYVAESEEEIWQVYFASVENGNGYGNTVTKDKLTQTFTNVKQAEGDNPATADFEIVWDISATANCWMHLGQASHDIDGEKVTEGKDSVTVGGKTYTLVPQATTTASPEIKITDAAE